jgi:hypothetical protein
MNKFLLALVLSVSALTASAGPASIALEFENEQVQGNSGADKNSLSIIPGYVLDNGVKLDVKLKGSQVDVGNATTVAIEPRVKYMVEVAPNLAIGGRVSLGEEYQTAGNYSFYTIEPMAAYAFNNKWAGTASVKYKDGTGALGAESFTTYVGGAYHVNDTQVVSAKVYHRDITGEATSSNGIEANYSIGF